MNKTLKNKTKKELLEIISNMKKKDLIHIIENKYGGYEELIKETKTSSRKSIVFNKNKETLKTNLAMANDNLYLENYNNNNNLIK
jgi:hypothetical protein